MSSKSFRPTLRTIKSGYYGDVENGGIKEKIGEIFGGDSNELPMYKDKPNTPRGWRKGQKGNKVGVLVLILLGFLWFTGMLPGFLKFDPATFETKTSSDPKVWATRQDAVKKAFTTSWDYYAEHGWGLDEFHPVSQRGRNMGCKQGSGSCPPVGWIIVDALDTAIMMNLTSRVAKAREWISTSLDFSKPNSEMNTFETTIRVLGGLLSAHYLSSTFPHLAPQADDDIGAKGEDLYIEKAVDLADRLLAAYDTPTGIPVSSVNLNMSVGIPSGADGGAASTAEAATVQLELKYVAKLTGEPLYWERAEAVMKTIEAQKREGGLLPIYIDPRTGKFRGENIRLGSRGDSYYEYLIKQYLQTGLREPIYRDMWEEALAGVKKYLVTWTEKANLTIIAEKQTGIWDRITGKMDHLVCFLPGSIVMGVTQGDTIAETKKQMGDKWGKKQEEDLILAEELMKTCWGMYAVTPTGLAPEISYFRLGDPPRSWNLTDPDWEMPRSAPLDPASNAAWRNDYDIHRNDVHNLLRPETVESLFYMWRVTGDLKYREWGWQMFQSFTTHCAVHDYFGKVVGYTSIDSVMVKGNEYGPHRNQQLTIGNKGGTMFRDNMEGFWLSETLKYFYLLFSDDVDEWGDLRKIVFNTEAHPFPRFDIGTEGKPWKTGWQRTQTSKIGM